LADKQFGFRPKHSTAQAVSSIKDQLINKLDNKKFLQNTPRPC